MLRGKLSGKYKDLNIGNCIVDYASANEEKVVDVDEVFEVEFSRNPLNFTKHFKAYSQLKKILRSNNYKLVHTHTPVGSVITRLATKAFRKKGLKVIYTAHGFHFYEGAPWHYWVTWYLLEKMMSRWTDLIITINSEDFERAYKKFHCEVKRIDGVGVDLERFYEFKNKQKLREKYGFLKDEFLIIYTAEFIERKNHRFLIQGLANILKENPKVRLVLIGTGRLEDEMKELARELGISEQVQFLGYVNKVEEYLNCGNLCISTCKEEGLGLGVLEAIACGCSILLADTRGHREIVGNEKKYLFDISDESNFSKKVRDAIANNSKYRMQFPERFSLENSLREMREIYREVLKK